MRRLIIVVLMCTAGIFAAGQTSSKFQPGTIMAVTPHPNSDASSSSVNRYDISLKVGNTMYVVLFTQPPGTVGVRYSAGQELLVSVGSNSITYNDMLGNSREVPILSRKTLPEKSAQP
jgi:hypothetical protein